MGMERGDRKTNLLDAAERLFREHGFNDVSLGRLAREVGIRKPTIYHHFPGGKEDLFVAVQVRMFERVGGELNAILEDATSDLSDQLHAAARWFLSQPPMFMLSMIHNDMDDLSPEGRATLARASYGLIMGPLIAAVARAQKTGAARMIDPHTVAGAFLAVLESNTIAHRAGYGSGDLEGMVAGSVDLLLLGALSR